MPLNHRAVSTKQRRHQSGERGKSRVAAFLPRCIFNLAMNEMLHRLSKYDCRLRYAMQPYVVGEKTYHARIRRTALSIYRQQPRIHYNRKWKSTKFTKNESFNVSDNQPRRAEASRQRPARKNGNRTNATKLRQPYD